MSPTEIPLPPPELRQMVGPTDPEAFDNPSGEPIYARFGLPLGSYDSVFDFGCGCGRLARQLLQQKPRPRRYVGIDVHGGMIDWCKENLSPIDPNFQFLHHDVYAPGYAPGNSLQLARPFPLEDGECSLFIAHSVFTHLFRRQTEYYLGEMARVLRHGGVAITTWFFFDRASFPFLLTGPFCLFTSEVTPTEAVIYDRQWFVDSIRQLGLGVTSRVHPPVAGHQWSVVLVKGYVGATDRFPLGEDGAEWLCGATLKPMATPAQRPEDVQKLKVASSEGLIEPRCSCPPPLFGALADLAATRQQLEATQQQLDAARRQLEDVRRSWAMRIGKIIVAPARTLRKLLRS